jgi:hypothetical protein
LNVSHELCYLFELNGEIWFFGEKFEYSQFSSFDSWPTETSSNGPPSIFSRRSSMNVRTLSRWLRETNAARLWSSMERLKFSGLWVN